MPCAKKMWTTAIYMYGCAMAVSSLSTTDSETLLLSELFSNYSKHVRPRNNSDLASPTRIEVVLYPLNLLDLDERAETIHLRLGFLLQWTDSRLGWTSADHQDVDIVYYPQSHLWLPPISFDKDISELGRFGHEDNLVTIHSSARVMWYVKQNFKLSCDIYVSFYPFDTQTCKFRMEFVPMVVSQVSAQSGPDGLAVFIGEFETGGTWEYLEIKCDFDRTLFFQIINYEFVLRRRTAFYVLNIVLPVVFLSTTASVVFILPAEAGEKMGVSISVLLAYSVYLSIITDNLPQTSRHVCYIQVFLTTILAITAMAVLLAVLVLHFHHKPPSLPVGKRTASLIRCFRNTHTSDRSQVTPTEIPVDDVTWAEVAKTIDRVVFASFSFVISVGTIFTFTYLSLGGRHTATRDPLDTSCDQK